MQEKDRTADRIEAAKAMRRKWTAIDDERFAALSAEEQADIEERSTILDLKGELDEPVVDLFKSNAPIRKTIPLPRGFGYLDRLDKGRELAEATWNEFQEIAMRPGGLAELETIRVTLRRIEEEQRREADEVFSAVVGHDGNFDPFEATVEEKAAFRDWFESGIQYGARSSSPLWKRMTPTMRSFFIRERQRIQQLEDNAESARFRATVCEIVTYQRAMFGEVDTWNRIGEHNQPTLTANDDPKGREPTYRKEPKTAREEYARLQRDPACDWFGQDGNPRNYCGNKIAKAVQLKIQDEHGTAPSVSQIKRWLGMKDSED